MIRHSQAGGKNNTARQMNVTNQQVNVALQTELQWVQDFTMEMDEWTYKLRHGRVSEPAMSRREEGCRLTC